MKKIQIITLFLFLLSSNLILSQEWKNLKSYQKETNNIVLKDGCWLKKDRKNKTSVWKNANVYNLLEKGGYLKYITIKEKRDFYIWFDEIRIKQGHDIKWIGIASIAANQLSKLNTFFVKGFIVRNKEIIYFTQIGSKKVFAFAFPKMKNLYTSSTPLKGKEAKFWNQKYGLTEQCEVLEPLFQNLSQKALNKLERIAKGKGIYSLGVPKKLRFIGNIDDCKNRYNHGINTLLPHY